MGARIRKLSRADSKRAAGKRPDEPKVAVAPATTAQPTPPFTLVKVTKKGGSLSKRITLGPDGELKIDSSACAMSRGRAQTVIVNDGMFGLAQLYSSLSPNEAIVLSNTDLGTEAREVCTESAHREQRKQDPNVICRSKRFLSAVAAPGLQLFEVDDHGLPDGQTAPDAEGMVALLDKLLPELDLRAAAKLLTHSTSSHVFDKESGRQLKGEGGKHLALLLSDLSRASALKTLLEVRQWANEYGHIYISRDGRQLERTVFDLSVFAPERLVFEAGAVLGEGLEQRRPVPIATEGHALDMSRLPSPTLEERERATSAKRRAREATREQADQARAVYIRDEAGKLVAQCGIAQAEAERIVRARAEAGSLDDGDVLTFTDKGNEETETVGHVLDHVEQFFGRAMRDPLEPENGRSKAMILRGPGGQPYVQSYAHGGRRFTFSRIVGQEGAADQALFCLSDLANGHRIAKAFGQDLIATATGWYVFTGRHWARGDNFAEQRALNLSRLVLQDPGFLASVDNAEGNDSAERAPDKKAKPSKFEWLEFAKNCENRSRIAAALDIASTLLWRDVSEMNSDPWLFNVMNGTIDLRTGVLRPHDRGDLITMLAPVEFVPSAACPTFERTILEVFGGDVDLVRFFQRFLGYSLTGLTIEQQILIPWGDGSNGKSTILGAIQKVLGRDYCGAAAPKLLEQTRSDRHPTEIADLYGKRVVIASESEEGAQLREAFLKLATGSDWLKGRFMHKDFFAFEPTHKFVLQTNYKPDVKGVDYAIWRRLLLLPFEIIFGDEAAIAAGDATQLKDKTLPEKLSLELDGVLAWMVRGSSEWQRIGLAPPSKVQAATEAYREEQDRIGQFVAEVCECDTKRSTTQAFLYSKYQSWAQDNGYHSLGSGKFRKQLLKAMRGKVMVERSTTGPLKNFATYKGIGVKAGQDLPLH